MARAGKQVRKGKGRTAAESVEPLRSATRSELLDMDRAIGILKTTRSTFYRWLRSGKVKGMKIGRQWRFYKEDIERFLRGDRPRIELAADIGPLVQGLEDRLQEVGGAIPGDQGPDEDAVTRAVGLMIRLGVAAGASDIHLEPYEDAVHLRLRLDGVLHPMATYDLRLQRPIVEQWKTMAACDVHENRRPQDGRVLLGVEGVPDKVDVRVSFLPAQLGEAVTARILRRDAVRLDLDRIDFLPRDRQRLTRWIRAPWGLIVVTGPTGCGKTTTLYACLNRVVNPAIKVLSVEDPVEFLIGGVTQVPVRPADGMTFAAALRGFLRSDPDVILVGEIRDLEVLNTCFQAALTGHLVLTTLHTDDAATALRRMVDVGAEPFLVGDAVKLIASQRLVRMLCPDCARDDAPGPDALADAALLARSGGVEWDGLAKRWRRAVGCETCKFTGFRGRQVLAEMLEVTPEIAAAVRRGAGAQELRKIAVGQGMTTMAGHGVIRAAAGETSLEEALATAPRL